MKRLLPHLIGLRLISLAGYGSVIKGRPKEGSDLDLFLVFESLPSPH